MSQRGRSDILIEGLAILELKLTTNGTLHEQLRQLRRYLELRPQHLGVLVRLNQTEVPADTPQLHMERHGDELVIELKVNRRPPSG